MPSWLTGRNLALAAGCAGAVAVVLFPASLITLGLGAALGYKGRSWLSGWKSGAAADPQACTSDPIDQEGGRPI